MSTTILGCVYVNIPGCLDRRLIVVDLLVSAAKCAKAFGQLITMGVLCVATDLALIILPLPLIFKSRLPVLR